MKITIFAFREVYEKIRKNIILHFLARISNISKLRKGILFNSNRPKSTKSSNEVLNAIYPFLFEVNLK